MDQSLKFDLELIRRYDKAGPRYTSYPTALELHEGFGEADYRAQIEHSNRAGGPLSLYFHIPFCDTVCYYCACNKIITKNRAHAEPYLERLYREIELQSALFSPERQVEQLHWGGGTPTFLSHGQMAELMAKTRLHFRLRDDDCGEYSIEVDPRATRLDTVAVLRDLGFNRISLGVQDFDPKVQKAVNRLQSEEETFAVLEAARRRGFRSTNIDLIYGLPLQTVESFGATLDKIIQAAPERLSVFNYAHLPQRFKVQRQIDAQAIPTPAVKLEILQSVIKALADAGYVYIGMDHFAKPDDELAVAQRENKLYRNFQGYSTHADCDLVGIGMTSIGRVGDAYIQNLKEMDRYVACLDGRKLPVHKGLLLNVDDKVRRAVISQLICHFGLEFGSIDRAFGIDFGEYFCVELAALRTLQNDGLISLSSSGIDVLPVGRLLIRNVCMVFDRYLARKSQQQFSKVI